MYGEGIGTMNDYEKEHLARLRKANAECTLFLKRKDDFPIKEPCEVALYGNGARHTIKGGTGSGEVNSRVFTSALRGLKEAGFKVTTMEWLDAYDGIRKSAQQAFVLENKRRAKEKHKLAAIEAMGAVMPEPDYDIPIKKMCDMAIYVLARVSGEGSDRLPQQGDVFLTDTETRDILKLQEMYPKFLLVLNVCGPVDLSTVGDKVDNILLLSQLGVETGAVLADLILGRSYPSGKLATTWADWNDYCNVGDFGTEDDTRYVEGIYMGYRYFDSIGKKARFPFGFGLGYTTFAVHAEDVTAEKENIRVRASVENTGSFAGREVVQLYLSCPQGKLDQPYQQLVGFAKTEELQAGESATIHIEFKMSDAASYDSEKSRYILDSGEYILRLGSSSTATEPVAVIKLEEKVIVRKVRKLRDVTNFTDWKPESPVTDAGKENPEADGKEKSADTTVQISLTPDDFSMTTVIYDRECEIDPVVQTLSEEELVCAGIGAYDSRGMIASVIGESGRTVAGAAGETTGLLHEKGFPTVVMADGPAGLRLARLAYNDAKGAHSYGPNSISGIDDYLPKFIRKWKNRQPKMKPGMVVKEQYATALPIGTAIAQSFNTDYAKMCGDIVGDEMERFGIHLWLAPALNIQRSILCGRNFEYYSEDPFVSGVMAAAITDGVQEHPGCGTVIKHFAANNQETNRYNNNSMVSERALREIYLRGFEICLSHAKPCAVMTSYNLLNGTHTSERRDLIEDVLRSEFGFDGVVMTDWITGGRMLYDSVQYPMPDAGRVAKAGGDLFMPGSKADYKRCLSMVRSGHLGRKQLEINATRIRRMARKLAIKEQQ